MCGIFGVYSTNDSKINALELIFLGLKKLEYRGYDSAGISIIHNSKLKTIKCTGEVKNLAKKYNQNKEINSRIGIGHTRWATKGEINISNSHPQVYKEIAVVHNGIVENFSEILDFLKKEKAEYPDAESVDTKIIPFLIHFFIKKHKIDFISAYIKSIKMLKGNSAIVAINKETNQMICSTFNSPLYVGKQKSHTFFISSDIESISSCEEYYKLEKQDFICFMDTKEGGLFQISIEQDKLSKKRITLFKKLKKGERIEGKEENEAKYSHKTRKEIQDQTETIPHVIKEHLDERCFIREKYLKKSPKLENKLKKVYIVGSGSSYNVGISMKNEIENLLGVEIKNSLSSEMIYDNLSFLDPKTTLFVFISQSGETMDSIVCIKKIKKLNFPIMGVLSKPDSTISGMIDNVFYCKHGTETGVAATKSFTAQFLVTKIAIFATTIKNNGIPQKTILPYLLELHQLENIIPKVLKMEEEISVYAKIASKAKNLIFIGKGDSFGIASEISLKTKELSYLPCESIHSGELKHGHIAMVDKNTLVIAIIDNNNKIPFSKTLNSIEEIVVRKGKVLLISSKEIINSMNKSTKNKISTIIIPETKNETSFMILSCLVGQLFAYQTALILNKNIDRPRNLAKAITVE